jgi:hypothetical protein
MMDLVFMVFSWGIFLWFLFLEGAQNRRAAAPFKGAKSYTLVTSNSGNPAASEPQLRMRKIGAISLEAASNSPSHHIIKLLTIDATAQP